MASAFEIYLRTGRRVTEAAAALETKFNPWHDTDDGRFTFSGQGRYFPGRTNPRANGPADGFSGHGGSFGGGGAGGRWETSAPTAQGTRRPVPVRTAKSTAVVNRTANALRESRLTIPKNGYDFSIDAHVRSRQVSGELRLQQQPRSKRAQSDAGKPDRRATDDGGHFIAARFNGPREWFNHFAQDANFNRGSYRALEDKWVKEIRSGKRVFVDIVPHYRGTSMRPHMLTVKWTIDGKTLKHDFPNEKGGK